MILFSKGGADLELVQMSCFSSDNVVLTEGVEADCVIGFPVTGEQPSSTLLSWTQVKSKNKNRKKIFFML